MHGRVATTLAALAITFAGAASSAHAAVTANYPTAANARTFAASDGGWTATTATTGVCVLNCPSGAGTWQSTGGSGGSGDGALRSTFNTGLGVLADTTVTWTSPQFTVTGTVDQATLSANVRTQMGSLLTLLGGNATITGTLTDLTSAANTTTLSTVTLANGTTFAPVAFAVPANRLVNGHNYTLSFAIRSTTGSVAAVAQNGTIDLDDVSLTTSDLMPPDTLTAAVSCSGTPVVSGSVDPHNQATSVVVHYGTSTAYGAVSSTTVLTGSGAQSYSVPMAGLTPGQIYHFRVVATNADGSASSADQTCAVPLAPGNGGPRLDGDLRFRVRYVVYDIVPGTTSVDIEILLDDGVTVYSVTPDVDLDGRVTITLPAVNGRFYIRIVRRGGGVTTYSPWLETVYDTVGPVNAGAPVVTGDIGVRVRRVRFVRASDAVTARIQIITLGGTLVDTVDVPAGGEYDITLPDNDGTYVIRVIQIDAAGNETTSPGTSTDLQRVTRGSGTDVDVDDGTPSNGGGSTTTTTTTTVTNTTTTVVINSDPGGWGSLLTSCYGNAKLALTDVRPAGRKVSFAGVAALPTGTAVAIVDTTGKTVATTKVAADGRFAAAIKRPKASVLKKVRYGAVAGTAKAAPVKATRIASVSSLKVSGATATVAGKVNLASLKGKRARLTFSLRGGRGGTACSVLGGGKLKTIGKVKVNAKTGTFSAKVKLPSATGRVAVRVAVGGSLKTATLYAVR
jgi:hypothetical protein